jgi:ubiquinone/menaquinone biosynthesis C-methylase UbiE
MRTILEEEYYYLTKKLFAAWAPFYDMMVMPIAGVRRKAVEMIGVQPGASVLDVATGTGRQAFAFARKGYNVVGIDLIEAMLNKAKAKNRYQNLQLANGDATSLPFEKNSFDASCVSFALHDMPLTIREKVLLEMHRVTRPEGVILIVDYALPRNKVGSTLVYHLVKLYESRYYAEFIHSDLEGLLNKTGIHVEDARQVVFGAARILKGTLAIQSVSV